MEEVKRTHTVRLVLPPTDLEENQKGQLAKNMELAGRMLYRSMIRDKETYLILRSGANIAIAITVVPWPGG